MKLCVGQYGGREYHPGPRHWSFLLMLSEQPNSSAQAFQLCGNWKEGFFYKNPSTVTPCRSQSFLGKVEVGEVDAGKYLMFAEDVKGVPIINGNQGWNCQDWIVDVLVVLKKKGYNVSTPTKQELLTRLNALLPPQKDPRVGPAK
ncbi:hypothetical protein CVT24_000076 [Panaeolus cyanescens]|uniref:Uncharacterized protein n=1 Tax=Panaeolus cyanescens TaxID=181874 RepID=A0A409VSK1_9AGAR|nr:hypothetical protein CVT24_000076 [Panaeolus cyanescens]